MEEKKKIVVLTDNYYPHPMAGGICAHQVAKGLLNQNYDVHVVCLNRGHEKKLDIFEGITVHRINNPIVYKLRDLSEKITNEKAAGVCYSFAIALNRFFKLLFLQWYPLMSPMQVLSYVKCCSQINNADIVAEYFSIESLIAGAYLKKRYGNGLILYNVDSLSNINSVEGISISYARKKGLAWERKLFGMADGIILMRCHERHYKRKVFDPFRNKMRYSDLPLMERKNGNDSYSKGKAEHDTVEWIYTGTLSSDGRPPFYLIEIFKKLSMNFRLNFYSKGDCEEYLHKQAVLDNRIIVHGHVPKNELDKAYREANFFISIGNKTGSFLPSKTIEYISYCKPIIHFSYQKHDVCMDYLERYGHALIIDAYKGEMEKDIVRINEFLGEESGVTIRYEEVSRKFKENTPEYTADLIKSFIDS